MDSQQPLGPLVGVGDVICGGFNPLEMGREMASAST